MGAIGGIVARGSVMYGAAVFLQSQGLTARTVGAIAVVAGTGIWTVMHYLTRRKQ